eukprot:1177715-Pyramimonas_sp.AAC.1
MVRKRGGGRGGGDPRGPEKAAKSQPPGPSRNTRAAGARTGGQGCDAHQVPQPCAALGGGS